MRINYNNKIYTKIRLQNFNRESERKTYQQFLLLKNSRCHFKSTDNLCNSKSGNCKITKEIVIRQEGHDDAINQQKPKIIGFVCVGRRGSCLMYSLIVSQEKLWNY